VQRRRFADRHHLTRQSHGRLERQALPGHSRKPDFVRDRIERLVLGPYLELFARAARAITLTNAQRHSISEMLRKTAGDT